MPLLLVPVIGVDSLVSPLVVISLGNAHEALVSNPRTDHGSGEEVSVVKTYETTGEISPGETHFYILLRKIYKQQIRHWPQT